jgi:hypothetical protein
MAALADRAALIDQWQFGFDCRQIPTVTEAGTRYFRQVWVGMPHISPRIIKSTFYLYRTADHAKRGANPAGTGFLLGINIHEARYWAIYAISNWHVTHKEGASVIRINRFGKPPEIFDLDPSEWTFVPNGPDLSATQIPLSQKEHDFTFIESSMAVARDHVKEGLIGAGEDVFMPGLFVDHRSACAPVREYQRYARRAYKGGNRRGVRGLHSRHALKVWLFGVTSVRL